MRIICESPVWWKRRLWAPGDALEVSADERYPRQFIAEKSDGGGDEAGRDETSPENPADKGDDASPSAENGDGPAGEGPEEVTEAVRRKPGPKPKPRD